MMKHQVALVCGALLALTTAGLAQNGKPLTLQECISIALRGNSSLLNAERRYRITGTDVARARAGILPALDLALSSGRFRQGSRTRLGDVPVGIDPVTGQAIFQRRTLTQAGFSTSDHSAQISLAVPLFDFGANWNRIRQAGAAEDASAKTYAAA
ncbi:MAG: TolC family protein, partial [candidate division KSB1 bacterium]|nr:TolC family protein [candidate division KSB1 bacterium]